MSLTSLNAFILQMHVDIQDHDRIVASVDHKQFTCAVNSKLVFQYNLDILALFLQISIQP